MKKEETAWAVEGNVSHRFLVAGMASGARASAWSVGETMAVGAALACEGPRG